MENKYENGMLTIKLNTSINSDNAKKTEDEIFALRPVKSQLISIVK